MTRKEYVAMLRQRYEEGTLDEALGFDNDVPDQLIRDIFPELFHH